MSKKTKQLSPLEQKINDFVYDKFTRIKASDRIFFVEHLSTMLSAGLSIIESLNILEKESSNPKIKKIIHNLKIKVEKGEQFSESLSAYPKFFPTIYVKMIASGEISGQLENALKQVTTQMKKNYELNSSIKGAMIYPAVIIVAMILVGILMVVFILPKMMEMFNDFGGELPLPTRILIKTTNFLSKPLNLFLILISFVGIIGSFLHTLHHVKKFQIFIHKLNLHWPIFGKIIKDINLARFSMTLSSLLSSTIPIIQAIEITAETCSNLTYRLFLKSTIKKIKTGTPLSEILNSRPDLFPPIVTEMIMVGEKTGEVNKLLSELSIFYSNKVDKTMKNFSTVIEPIIIVSIGIVVAGLAVAVIMPMYSLVENF